MELNFNSASITWTIVWFQISSSDFVFVVVVVCCAFTNLFTIPSLIVIRHHHQSLQLQCDILLHEEKNAGSAAQ